MLYQLDIYYKSLINNKYAYFIIRKSIQKLRFIYYFASFAFIKKKVLVEKNNTQYYLSNSFKSHLIGKFFKVKDPEIPEWIDSFEHNSKFLDVGANIGTISLYAAKKGIETIAIEPNFINFSQLNENIVLNNLKNISTGLFFLEESTKLSTIKTELFTIGNSTNYSFNNLTKNQKYVKNILQAYALDKFCEEIDFWPNYIKCDTDGNELGVLKGCEKTLLHKNFKSLHIEFMDTVMFDNVLNYLNQINFRYKIASITATNPKSFNIIINKNI